MFNNQTLFDRTMRVKMDGQAGAASRPDPLPSGLKSIGPSLNNLQMNSKIHNSCQNLLNVRYRPLKM